MINPQALVAAGRATDEVTDGTESLDAEEPDESVEFAKGAASAEAAEPERTRVRTAAHYNTWGE